jgi:hypothetical protein
MDGLRERKQWIAPLSLGLLLASAAAAADDPPAPAPGGERPAVAAPAAPDGAAAPATDRCTALVSRMVLKVVNPDDVRARLATAVREAGGFPVLVTDDRLELKLPPERLDDFLKQVAGEGLLLEKTLERQDLTLEIAQLEGQLEAKRVVLAKLRGFFDDSGVQGTLRIEQTMTELVTEIEQVKGRLRVLEDRARFALVEISFRFKQRDRLIYVQSPFDWLNTVNLDRFLGEF